MNTTIVNDKKMATIEFWAYGDKENQALGGVVVNTIDLQCVYEVDTPTSFTTRLVTFGGKSDYGLNRENVFNSLKMGDLEGLYDLKVLEGVISLKDAKKSIIAVLDAFGEVESYALAEKWLPKYATAHLAVDVSDAFCLDKEVEPHYFLRPTNSGRIVGLKQRMQYEPLEIENYFGKDELIITSYKCLYDSTETLDVSEELYLCQKNVAVSLYDVIVFNELSDLLLQREEVIKNMEHYAKNVESNYAEILFKTHFGLEAMESLITEKTIGAVSYINEKGFYMNDEYGFCDCKYPHNDFTESLYYKGYLVALEGLKTDYYGIIVDDVDVNGTQRYIVDTEQSNGSTEYCIIA